MNVSDIHHELFENPSFSVYAVIDGASTPKLLSKLEEHEPEYVCLLRGELPFDLAEAAPYLVLLEENSEFSKWLAEECISKFCCIYAHSTHDFASIRKHFRSLLDVELPDETIAYFRFYDPKVMRIYLPTCNQSDKEILFGGTVINLIIITEEQTLFKETHPEISDSSYKTVNMLKIRQTQLNALATPKRIAFINKIKAHLSEKFSNINRIPSDNEITDTIDFLYQHDIKSDNSLRNFLELCHQYTWDFYLLDKFMEVLNKKHIPEHLKLLEIQNLLVESRP